MPIIEVKVYSNNNKLNLNVGRQYSENNNFYLHFSLV